MYIFLLVFVTIICFSMVLESMKKPENLFVCLEYDINGNVKNQFTALLGLCWGPVACSWFEMTSVFSPLFTLRITQLACVTIKEDF